jgi:hypothetical protein
MLSIRLSAMYLIYKVSCALATDSRAGEEAVSRANVNSQMP